jgi:hypothetical protein
MERKWGTLNTKEANRNKIIELMGEAKPEIEEVPQAGKAAPSTNGEKNPYDSPYRGTSSDKRGKSHVSGP